MAQNKSSPMWVFEFPVHPVHKMRKLTRITRMIAVIRKNPLWLRRFWRIAALRPDTNVLVRLLVAEDPAQTRRALAYLEARRPLWVSTVVLVETVWVLTAVCGWSRAQNLAMLQTASNSRDFALQSVDTVRAAIAAYASSGADFSDCLALELARAEGHLPFATFDKTASKLPDSVIP